MCAMQLGVAQQVDVCHCIVRIYSSRGRSSMGDRDNWRPDVPKQWLYPLCISVSEFLYDFQSRDVESNGSSPIQNDSLWSAAARQRLLIIPSRVTDQVYSSWASAPTAARRPTRRVTFAALVAPVQPRRRVDPARQATSAGSSPRPHLVHCHCCLVA